MAISDITLSHIYITVSKRWRKFGRNPSPLASIHLPRVARGGWPPLARGPGRRGCQARAAVVVCWESQWPENSQYSRKDLVCKLINLGVFAFIFNMEAASPAARAGPRGGFRIRALPRHRGAARWLYHQRIRAFALPCSRTQTPTGQARSHYARVPGRV